MKNKLEQIFVFCLRVKLKILTSKICPFQNPRTRRSDLLLSTILFITDFREDRCGLCDSVVLLQSAIDKNDKGRKPLHEMPPIMTVKFGSWQFHAAVTPRISHSHCPPPRTSIIIEHLPACRSYFSVSSWHRPLLALHLKPCVQTATARSQDNHGNGRRADHLSPPIST